MQDQINALREAFSSDTSKPFELKPTLGALASPSVEKQLTPPLSQQSSPDDPAAIDVWPTLRNQALPGARSAISELEAQFAPSSMPSHITSHPVMGYIPEDFSAQPSSAPTSAPYGMNQLLQSSMNVPVHEAGYPAPHTPGSELQTPVWDPSSIISQWNTAFGNPVAPPSASPASEEPSMLPANLVGGPTSMAMLNQNTVLQPSVSSHNHSPVYGQNISPVAGNMMSQAGTAPAVTSVMWQDAFTDAYISGHNKRHRDDTYDGSMYVGGAKRRG